MTLSEKKYERSMNAWFKTQQIGIDSCDVNISFYKRQIEILNKSIKAELEEKAAKVDAFNQVKKEFNKWISKYSTK